MNIASDWHIRTLYERGFSNGSRAGIIGSLSTLWCRDRLPHIAPARQDRGCHNGWDLALTDVEAASVLGEAPQAVVTLEMRDKLGWSAVPGFVFGKVGAPDGAASLRESDETIRDCLLPPSLLSPCGTA